MQGARPSSQASEAAAWIGQAQLDAALVWACCTLALRSCAAGAGQGVKAGGGEAGGWKDKDAEVVSRVVSVHRRLLPLVLCRITDVCVGMTTAVTDKACPHLVLALSGSAEAAAAAMDALLSDGGVQMLLGEGGEDMQVLEASLSRIEGSAGKGGSGGACGITARALDSLRTQHAMLAAVATARKRRCVS